FALLLALYLSRTISAPILKLKAAAAAMAQGNFKVRVPSGSDEIGALATAFNLMAAELGKVEKLRKQLSADLAHELRAPLTIIQGQTEALLDGVIEEEAEKEKFLRDILGETVRLSEMVRALLEIAHLDRGAKALNKQVFSLKTLIVSLAEKYQAIAKEKNINLTTILPPTDDLLLVEADEARIGQVVRNFLDNALRYTPPGKEVLIRLQAQDTSVQIEITDHGPGIPAAEQPLIWERFYKVNKARTAGEGGVGLGLAIAKEIIQASGGQIWVKSAEGKGATFGFSLPRTSPPAPLT
ncbi:MAG TPA: two-component sensor histidine kinase, partial [Firmicutes bacterium]|nr:two-component sensor histidine kinase [Bacillota bacterium]